MTRELAVSGSGAPADIEAIGAVSPILGVEPGGEHAFDERFRKVFECRHSSLYRYVARLSDDPALAADVAQEAFVRLYERRSMPEDVGAWLVTVANNLFRNQWQRRKRRERLMSSAREALTLADPPPPPDAAVEAGDRRRLVRGALDTLALRDRQLLLLRYEGYSYRELATALDLAETSVGTLLARAKNAFRRALQEDPGAHE